MEAIKYLDILTFADSWKKKSDDSKEKCLINPLSCDVCIEPSLVQEELHHTDINRNHVVKLPSRLQEDKNTKDEVSVELLLKKCQNVENYVPVKEKLVLFESLCKLGRVRSSEDVSIRNTSQVNSKRARSLHDLSNCLSSNGVREICKYFEKKTDQNTNFKETKPNKRLIYSDTVLYKKNAT